MAVTANLFANSLDQAFQAKINWPSDSIKMALLTSIAAPNLSTWIHFSDLTNETSGTGYTAGGLALSAVTHTVTAANSFGTAWAGTTAYSVGNIVRPSTGNGYLYECVVAGTSGSSAATLNSGPTQQGATVTDGTVTWSNIGESISQWSSSAVQWTNSTISAQYGVIYDSTPATAATQPLVALINFGQTVSSTNGNFTVTPASLGWFWLAPQ